MEIKSPGFLAIKIPALFLHILFWSILWHHTTLIIHPTALLPYLSSMDCLLKVNSTRVLVTGWVQCHGLGEQGGGNGGRCKLIDKFHFNLGWITPKVKFKQIKKWHNTTQQT